MSVFNNKYNLKDGINYIKKLNDDLRKIDEKVEKIEYLEKEILDLLKDFNKEIKIEEDKKSVHNNLINLKEKFKEINKEIKRLKSEMKKNSYSDIYKIRIKSIEENYNCLIKEYKELLKSINSKNFLNLRRDNLN
jgi:DNA repair exonuclease SbcCD ATPase subunit